MYHKLEFVKQVKKKLEQVKKLKVPVINLAGTFKLYIDPNIDLPRAKLRALRHKITYDPNKADYIVVDNIQELSLPYYSDGYIRYVNENGLERYGVKYQVDMWELEAIGNTKVSNLAPIKEKGYVNTWSSGKRSLESLNTMLDFILNNSSKVIDATSFRVNTATTTVEFTPELMESISGYLKSRDKDNIKLALELLTNIDLTKNKYLISKFFMEYGSFLNLSTYYNSTSFKSFRKELHKMGIFILGMPTESIAVLERLVDHVKEDSDIHMFQKDVYNYVKKNLCPKNRKICLTIS